jgi:hypothetical protein
LTSLLSVEEGMLCGKGKACYDNGMNEYSPLISEFGSAEEEAAYDVWLKAKVARAMASTKPRIPHDEAMARVKATLERAKARSNKC